jgi:phosphoribosyl-ATP pyrophosphohydrolase
MDEQNPSNSASFVLKLYDIIMKRMPADPATSYTARLCASGLETILAKVEEEANEVIEAARREGRQRLIEEASDLFYHVFVLLAHEGITLEDIGQELERRHARATGSA